MKIKDTYITVLACINEENEEENVGYYKVCLVHENRSGKKYQKLGKICKICIRMKKP